MTEKKTSSRKSKRKSTGTPKGKPQGRSRATRGSGASVWTWILALALVLVVVGVGALKWSQTRQGRAALLSLGSQKMYGEVQEAVDQALAAALPEWATGPAGAAGQRSGGEMRAQDYDWPAAAFGPEAAIRCRVVPVSPDLSYWEVQEHLATAVRSAGARILWGERLAPDDRSRRPGSADEDRDLLRLDIGVTGRATHTLVLHRPERATALRWGRDGNNDSWRGLRAEPGPVVALLIDDWGYGNSDAVTRLSQLAVPLTMAVLPGLPYSRQFALQATDLILPDTARRSGAAEDARVRRRAAGCPVEVTVGRTDPKSRRREIFLHLPMQPQGYPDPDPGPRAVLVGMDEADIAQRLDEALGDLPNVTGINNHMGSAATADAATMQALMNVLQRRDLIFIDSLTSARSVAFATARKAGVPAGRNRIFLDFDSENPATIAANLDVLVRSARARGFAIGIGHPHAATADVLLREVPRLQREGVRFVTVSELLALQAVADGDGG